MPSAAYSPDDWRGLYPKHPGNGASDARITAFRSAFMAVELAERSARLASEQHQIKPPNHEGDVKCNHCFGGTISEDIGGRWGAFDCPRCNGTTWIR